MNKNLLCEVKFLSSISSTCFIQIKQLFRMIFRSNSRLYSWDHLCDKLKHFLLYEIFALPLLSFVYDVELTFKNWFNSWIQKFNFASDNDISENDSDAVIIHAPLIDPTLMFSPSLTNDTKIFNNETWSLQDAVAYTLQQYLSKHCTLRKWSIGLDTRLTKRDASFSVKHRKKLIKYASFDCLSLAHIILFMYDPDHATTPIFINHSCQLGEYSLVNEPIIAPDLFRNHQQHLSFPSIELNV